MNDSDIFSIFSAPGTVPGRGAAPLRLRAHSPLLPASGPLWLSLQGPKLFLSRVLVSEETEGKDGKSGKLRHGWLKAVNPQTQDWSLGETWTQNAWGQDGQGPRKAKGRPWGCVCWGFAGGSAVSSSADAAGSPGVPDTPESAGYVFWQRRCVCALSWRGSSQFPLDLSKGPRSQQGQKALQETDLQRE